VKQTKTTSTKIRVEKEADKTVENNSDPKSLNLNLNLNTKTIQLTDALSPKTDSPALDESCNVNRKPVRPQSHDVASKVKMSTKKLKHLEKFLDSSQQNEEFHVVWALIFLLNKFFKKLSTIFTLTIFLRKSWTL
jgi:hypothetical protein